MGSSIKKFGFLGSKNIDMIMYFSRVFVNLGKRTAIIDASFEQDLKFSIPIVFENKITNYREVEIFLDVKTFEEYNCIDAEDFEIILINFGFNSNFLEEITDMTALFLITDFQRHNVVRLKKILGGLNDKKDLIKVYRDVVENKIGKKYIDTLLCGNANYIAEYILYLDDNEQSSILDSQYNDIFKFNKLGKEYKNMIIDAVLQYFDEDKKQVLKAYKKAEWGK